MPRPTITDPERGSARARLLEAATDIIRRKGFSATSVDDLCKAAGVTKGAYFHHFRSKEELGVAAARHWTEFTDAVFESASYRQAPDPLSRILGYLELRKSLAVGEIGEWTCLLGTVVQEVYETSPAIRDACAEGMFGHAAMLERDIAAAIDLHGIEADWTAESLAKHIQGAIQGSFILAKAAGDARLAVDSLEHLERYVSGLFRFDAQAGNSPRDTPASRRGS